MTAAPSRRAALAMALAVMPTAAAPTPPPALLRALANPALRTDATTLDPAGPDAELIRRCAVYLAAVVRYNAEGGEDVDDLATDPLWIAVTTAEAAVDALPPRTLAGIVAKANLAAELVTHEPQGDGWQADPVTAWAADITRDIIRLYGAEDAA